MTSCSKRRYVVPSASPPTTSDSSGSGSSSSDDNEVGNTTPSIKKKRRCTRNKPNYNESSSKPHFRESYVFSTALANLAASAVKHRMCDSIIIYHKGIPREPNRLTIKPPKVTSKLLATSSVKNRKREKEQEQEQMQIERETERKRSVKPRPRPVNKPAHKVENEVKCTKTNGSLKSPLTPPRSPSSLPLSAGDYSLSVSERIKCRARACAPKFYGESKDDNMEAEPSPGSSAVLRSPERERSAASVGLSRESRRRSAEKPRRQSNERLRERRARRDSIESDGEKIRSILENSEKGIKPEQTAVTSPVESKPKVSSSREFSKHRELPPKSLKSPKITKPEPKSVSPKVKEDSKPTVPIPKSVPLSSPKHPTKPSPLKSEKPKPRLSDSGGLFEAAMSQKIRSPVRLKKQISSETKTEPTPEKSSEPTPTPVSSVSNSVSKFKPVKQSSPSKETAPVPTSDSQDPNLPKFKPLPFSGNTKKSKTFKFRTPQGSKHEMNLVDSIFSTDANSSNPPELPPRINKSPTTPPVTSSKIPVTKLTDKPPRPELVMGIPNLQGPSKPPMLTPAHNIFQHGSLQHIIRTGPPPLSSPKIAVTTKCNQPGPPPPSISPASTINVGPKRASNEHHPASGEQRKKKRFAFPEEATSPVKVTSPISPSSPVTLKGPGSSRVSPISPIQASVDNILTTPILRNGLPLHKPSPKNSPQNRRLDLRAEFSGRRSPLVKVTNNTSPITPKASPSTVGQFYQPNVSVSLNSCSRNDLNLSDSVLEHSKLSGQQVVNRAPVVTINHQTIAIDQERGKEAPKPRLTVESDAFSKKQQQEIFARQQLYSRAFSPFSLPNSIPTTAAGKFNKQFELTQQLMQQHELGSLVDLHGRGEKESHSQPAFPTAAAAQLRQPPNNIQSARPNPRQQSPRQRTIPTELLMQQGRERLSQQERLLAQQRQHVATSVTRDHNVHSPLFAQRQESLLHRPPGAPNQHLQHLPYSGAMLNQIGYPIGLNPQLYKQLATDPALTQVTSAGLLQSLAGYQQLQLAAAAAGKFGPLAHLYQTNSKPNDDAKTPNQFGVIRP